MKKICVVLVAVFIVGILNAQDNIENKIKVLIGKMTLEEKVGQMTQLDLDFLGKGKDRFISYLPFQFDEQMLDSTFNVYKVGSILNTASTTPMKRSDWERIVSEIQKRSISATGIPVLYGVDAIHGTTYTIGSALMPQNITLGATFNRKLVFDCARVCAYETKASNIPWNFSPVVDLGRDPRWPRQWETFGEDAYLTSEMGLSEVHGYQGNNPNDIGKNNVAACLKHYMGYGASFSGKDRTPAILSENDMIEKYLYPFAKAVKGGALSVMVNSGQINGIPVHANKMILSDWLKDSLNWDGVIVTDWGDINNLYKRDKVVETQKEAVCLAINSGIDLAMVPSETSFCRELKELVLEGKVSEKRIDDAVSRVLRLKFRLGLFDKNTWSFSEYPDFGCDDHKKVSYDAACEGITLLKNKGYLLPLKANSRILVAGPNANSMRVLNGGWSYSWQGEKVDKFLPNGITILKALKDLFGDKNVVYEPGVTYNMNGKYWSENQPDFHSAVKAAKNVDYIILCLGENSYCEAPGNLDDLYLSDNQQELAKQLAATGKPVILILNEGRPRIISKIEPSMSAIIQTYLPGSEGARALADILIGKVNPSGKLPYTYPKYPNSLITYDYKPSQDAQKTDGIYNYKNNSTWQWGFGFGLSYTKFSYSNLMVDKVNFNPDDTLTISVDVNNCGKIGGKESVLVFVADQVASITPDVRRLKAFDKITLKPGETKKVEFRMPAKRLAFVDSTGKWKIEKGNFIIQIDNKFVKLCCNESKVWNGLYIE